MASGVDPDEEVELADGRGTANLEQTCRECRRPYHVNVEAGSAAAWSSCPAAAHAHTVCQSSHRRSSSNSHVPAE